MDKVATESHEKILDFLQLDRPIIFFDLETTGTNASKDKIIEVSAIKISPDGNEEFKARRINPEMNIPQEAIDVHGITNEDVKDAPKFKQIARSLHEFLGNCHLGGYGITHFDIRLLQNEFSRVELDFSIEGRAIIDAKSIFFIDEPRDLSAALKYYCNKEITNHHSAKADVDSTIEVLIGQFEKNKNKLPNDIHELSEYCNPRKPNYIDRDGKFTWFEDEAIINFGKHSGEKLKDLVHNKRDYLEWILNGNFSNEVKVLIKDAFSGSFPKRDKA